MRSTPLVGVSTYYARAAWGAWDRPAAVLPAPYFELVAAAGARPLLLPPVRSAPGGPTAGAAAVIEALDGLVLVGGGDLDPAGYGLAGHPAADGVDLDRDRSEEALLASALARDLPVLAICRGLQLLNVHQGGTLLPHLPDAVHHDGHRPGAGQFAEVDVVTVAGTRTAAILGAKDTVRCSHHQAIDRLGAGLAVTARSVEPAGRPARTDAADGLIDGVVEAVELVGHRFVIGVQWHPEETGDGRLFDALVAATPVTDDPEWPVGPFPDPAVRREALEGRVAVITGASGGLGAGLARHWARAGLRLGLCARRCPEPSPALPAARVVRAPVDVTDFGALAAFTTTVVERFGQIDLWVNNAGVLDPVGPLADADPSAVAGHLAINVAGTAYGSMLFARHLAARPGPGVLVNLSSGAAVHPYAGLAVYSAGKAAVDALTMAVGPEEYQHGLRAYAVTPGHVDTGMQAALRSADPERFPATARFRQIGADGAFNPPAWVAEKVLELAFGDDRPEGVRLRVPQAPRP